MRRQLSVQRSPHMPLEKTATFDRGGAKLRARISIAIVPVAGRM